MKRTYPISALGSLCMGLTGAAGCGSDAIVGDWQLIELMGDETPLIQTDPANGVTNTFTGGLKVFDDLNGYVTYYDSDVMDFTYEVGGSEVNRSLIQVDREMHRVWVRPSESVDSEYQILYLEQELSVDCTMTDDSLLTCQSPRKEDPAIFQRVVQRPD